MAFCTSCGSAIDPNAKFCTKCGASMPVSTTPPASSTAAPAASAGQTQGGGAFKVVLIVLGIVFAIAIIAVGVIGYGAYRLAQNVKVEESGSSTRVETPFGTVETDKSGSEEVARKMGVEVYPGARSIEGNAVMTIGGKRVLTANFESEDDAEKVFEFYKERYSDARIVNQTEDHYNIMVGKDDEMLSIMIRPERERTYIAFQKFEAND